MLFYILFACLLVTIIFLFRKPEQFTPVFYEHSQDTQWRGINMLGVNSDDAHFATDNIQACQDVCTRNKDCKGFNFYQPGNRCYIYATGDFVYNSPGFIAGKKISG